VPTTSEGAGVHENVDADDVRNDPPDFGRLIHVDTPCFGDTILTMNKKVKYMAMDQYLYIPFLGG